MNTNDLFNQLQLSQEKVEMLSLHTQQLLSEPELLGIVLEELSVALEELQVQYEQLAATRSELELDRRFYQDLFDLVPEAYLVTNSQGVIQNANQATANLLETSQKFLPQKPLILFVAETDRKSFFSKLDQTLKSKQPETWEIQLISRGQKIFLAEIVTSLINNPENNSVTEVCWLIRDISESRQKEEKLSKEVLHDNLTKLPNRVLLLDCLEYDLKRCQRDHNHVFGICFIDLDDFKRINDTYGHLCGDNVLIDVANRLSNAIRSIDRVFRLYGDEFIVLLEDISDRDEIINCVQRLQESLSVPFICNNDSEIITASIGIVLGNSTYQTPEQILTDADTAMYQVRNNQK